MAVLVLVLAGGAWWWFASRTNADYKAQLTAVTTVIKKDITEKNTAFEQLAKEADSAKSAQALQQLEDSLKQSAERLPPLPSLLGIGVSSQDDTSHRSQLAQRLKALAQDLQVSRELLQYSRSVTTILQEVTLKTGASADQQKALAEAWQTTIDKLKALTPPQPITQLHSQIIAIATKVQTGIAVLPELFNKKDIPGFAAKQKEIETYISELRNMSPGIVDTLVSQDKTIGQGYHELSRLL
ncbi:MAG TPA: hypothetical protein VFO38_02400 [Candidatus Saccharimonadales bacterium]|nr:hypothetical protein [Candidatus Saccharimonadales bacterium]